MNELAMFAGAGGGLLASRWMLGWTAVGYVEWAPYPVSVLQARIADGMLDDAPVWGDVRTFDGAHLRGCVDVVSAGFPCQPFSAAGKQRAADDPRNGWPSTVGVVKVVRPAWFFGENVAGLLWGSHGYFGVVLAGLSRAGYDVAWDCISASVVGAYHPRDRVWIVAHNRDDQQYPGIAGPAAIGGWPAEPPIPRMITGVPHGRKRIRTLGEGQVPRCTAAAWRLLSPRFPLDVGGRVPFASLSNGQWVTSQLCFRETAGMDRYAANWPRAGMVIDGRAYSVRPAAPMTRGRTVGLLPTPTAHQMGSNTTMRRNGETAKSRVRQWRSPSAMDANGPINRPNKTFGPRTAADPQITPSDQAARWPTAANRQFAPPGQAMMWPTVTAMDATGLGLYASTQTKPGSRHSLGLTAAVKRYPTPTAFDRRGHWAITGAGHGNTLSEMVEVTVGEYLNPRWLEWLMGWPDGWTDTRPMEKNFHKWLQQHGAKRGEQTI